MGLVRDKDKDKYKEMLIIMWRGEGCVALLSGFIIFLPNQQQLNYFHLQDPGTGFLI